MASADPSNHSESLRVGFVTGVMPDKWARAWRDRNPRGKLELIPLDPTEAEPALRGGAVDLVLLRLPVERQGLHVVTLYREVPVVVVARDHIVAAYDEIALADLIDERFIDSTTMTLREAVEVAASGSGVLVVPMSVARLHHRKDAVAVRLTDVEETEIALAWLVERDGPAAQEFVGVVRGRGTRSSR